MIAVAFLVNSYLAAQKAKEQAMNPEYIFNLAFVILISGIVGARLLYVISNIDYYLANPSEIVMLQRGGMSWFGSLFLGALGAVIYLRRKRLNIYEMLDLIIPFVALGQAIGRIGCLLNGCCYGEVSRYGLYFSVHDAVLIPTQMYSSLSLILIFFILRILQERQHKKGDILSAYLALYSIKRFIMEYLRADNEVIFFGLTPFQLTSIALLLFAIFLKIYLYLYKREK